MVLTIPIAQEQIRSFQDPNRPSIRILHALVRVLDWPDNVPIDPDPRVPKEGARCQEDFSVAWHVRRTLPFAKPRNNPLGQEG